MPYLIQFVPSFSVFFGGIFIPSRDPLPVELPPALQTKALSSPTNTKKKNDNAVKTRQGDKITEKKKWDRAVQESGYWGREQKSERKKVEQVIVQRSQQLCQLY